MPMVGIYEWECEFRGLRAWWVTGMRLGGAQVVDADENSVMLCTQNIQKKDTVKQEIPMGTMLTGGHTGHKIRIFKTQEKHAKETNG